MKQRRPRPSPRAEPEPIVRLEDLAPPEGIRGGTKKRVFGEEPSPPGSKKPDPG
jgi:hypothetical protein